MFDIFMWRRSCVSAITLIFFCSTSLSYANILAKRQILLLQTKSSRSTKHLIHRDHAFCTSKILTLRGGAIHGSSDGERIPSKHYDYTDPYSNRESTDYYGHDDYHDDYATSHSPSNNQRYNTYDESYNQENGDLSHSYSSTYSSHSASSRRDPKRPSTEFSIQTILKQNRQIGLPLIGAGIGISLLGISLFFNKMLLRLGNLCFLLGVVFTFGPQKTVQYFAQPKKMRASLCLGSGIFLVFMGYAILGIALEIFGSLNLFGNMFPLLLMFAKRLPFVGSVFSSFENTKEKRRDSSRERRYQDEDDENTERYY